MNQTQQAKPNSSLRCGTIAIIGRPNVGKSTLMNALIGQKISITSKKAQTTRHRITGVQTIADAQYIFLDTPGFQTRHNTALNRSLNRAVTSSLVDVDLILWVVEAGRFSVDDEKVLALLPKGARVFLLANKLDQITDKATLFAWMQKMSHVFAFLELFPVSAKQPKDIEWLLAVLKPYLPLSKFIYQADQLTDKSERFLAAEILREKVFRWTGDELPYTSTVVIDQFEVQGQLRRIFATILVDKQAHKAMMIGKKGERLKKINTEARIDMQRLFGGTIYLETFIKVRSGWADNETGLRAFGYDQE